MGTEVPRTPPRSASLKTSADTPVVVKQTSISTGNGFSLDTSRGAVMGDIGSTIPEVEWEFFQTNILPPLRHNIQVDEVHNQLAGDGSVVNNRWFEFPTDPSRCPDEENNVFAHLWIVIDSIQNAAERVYAPLAHQPRTLRYSSQPLLEVIPTYVKKKSKPDGHWVLWDAEGGLRWTQIAVPSEYKKAKGKTDLHDV